MDFTATSYENMDFKVFALIYRLRTYCMAHRAVSLGAHADLTSFKIAPKNWNYKNVFKGQFGAEI